MMGFLRFVVPETDTDSGVAAGLFRIAYALRNAAHVSEEHRQVLGEQLSWFAEYLPTPDRFNRTSSKGYYRRTTKGIAWFRDTASEHLARMQQLKRIAEGNRYSVHMIREDRIGYVVYED
ncbi:MAG TPA: hypothetical protein VNX47_13085, partial [Nevskia sp.]|nr:hypothetical protein [Nevskia sp.]